MQDRGQDPFIASKLSTLLTEAKFEDVQQETRTLDFGKSFLDKLCKRNQSNTHSTVLGRDTDPVAKEMLWSWKSAMQSLKPFLAHRLLKNPDEYNIALERYIHECKQYNWSMTLWAVCARKPSS